MRLAQTLVKAAVILAVIAATLGGAVALGSTLFEAPPRDAAEFAARVEAGSTTRLRRKRTAAERRYILEVGELCASETSGWATSSAGPRPTASPGFAVAGDPRGLRRGLRGAHAAARLPGRAARADGARPEHARPADGALEARRSGDRDGFETKRRAVELSASATTRMLRLGAPVCAAA